MFGQLWKILWPLGLTLIFLSILFVIVVEVINYLRPSGVGLFELNFPEIIPGNFPETSLKILGRH